MQKSGPEVPSLFSRTNVYNHLGRLWKAYRRHWRMFVSVLRIVVKLKLIWQPYGLLIQAKAAVLPSTPVSFYLTYFFSLLFPLLSCFLLLLLTFFYISLFLNPAFPPCWILSTCLFWFYETTHCISCLQSYMSSAGMCWWLSFSRSFMCVSCVAMAGMGCSSSKSVCHVSKICWVHRFTSRFCFSSSVLSPMTVSIYAKWLQRSTLAMFVFR